MEQLMSYFQMGGHGGFIWASYGMVFIFLLVLWVQSWCFFRSSQSELDGLVVDLPHSQAVKKNETET
jgi:heme exporter protein CcmD